MGLYCIDANQTNLIIWGVNNFEYQRLDILYMPCVANVTAGTCLNQTTFQDLQNYLVAPNIYFIMN